MLYGIDNVITSELQFFSNPEIKKVDTCMNYTRPPLAITIEPIRSAFINAKKRGIKIRYMTEITNDNIPYCKKLIELVDESTAFRWDKREFYGKRGFVENILLNQSKLSRSVIQYRY